MAGRPKLLALKKRIAEDDLEDEIFEAVAEGLSIGKMIVKFDITSRKMFYDWKGKEGPRHDKYKAARLIAAEAHAEMAGEILDNLANARLLTGPDVQAATARSKYQQWLASVKDRDQFGAQDKSPAITLNFNDLHFDALRNAAPTKRNRALPYGTTDTVQTSLAETQEAEIQEADFTVESAGAGNDGEADAQTGTTYGPITPPAPALALELADLL